MIPALGDFEATVERNSMMMLAAELDGHVSELHDLDQPGVKLWMVPAELQERVGFKAAVVWE